MNCHNPRFTSVEANDLKDVNYDRILEIAKQLTSNAAAYTVTIVGNFDEAAIRPLLEQYIASLPSQKKIVKGKNVDTDATGVVVNSFKRKMETPKAISMMIWTNKDIPYTLDNKIKTDIAGQVLSMIYLKKIREDASAAYSVGAQGSIRRIDKDTDCTMFAYCPMKPEKGETALSIMRDEMEQLAKTCDADMLTKVKEYMLKSYDDRTKTNNYWNGILSTYNEYGIDMHTAYKATVQAQTPQTITAFMTEFLKAGNRIEVVMMPEE